MNEDVKKQIETMVNSDDVVLFMKGNPDFPQCGFSANVVGLLNHFKIKFKSYDVLQDEVVRQGIKCGACVGVLGNGVVRFKSFLFWYRG